MRIWSWFLGGSGSALPAVSAAAELSLENDEIYTIYDPVALPEPLQWYYYLGICLALAALGIIIFMFFKRRKPQPVPQIPLHERTLAELNQARKYLEQNDSLAYTRKVSSILRNYLENRFAIKSTRQTTVEFLGSLEKISTTSKSLLMPHRQSLQICLEMCDLAKYAHKPAGRENMEKLEQSIRSFIAETTPREAG